MLWVTDPGVICGGLRFRPFQGVEFAPQDSIDEYTHALASF